MAFLHGVETVNVDLQGQTFQVVKSGVIGLIGIAPNGPLNQLTLCTKTADFAQFGEQLPGFTIPQSLDVIAKQGASTVLVINVFDPATHATAVSLESQTVVAGALKLAFAPIGAVSVFDSAGAPSTLVRGTDYTLDAFGNFKVLGNSVAANTVLKFTYKKLNLAAVTSSLIIGGTDGTTGVRTGSVLFELAYQTFGFNAKLFIAPGFSSTTAVATQLRVLAAKYRGIDYSDAPAGTILSAAIAGRGPAGSLANFNVSDERTELLYPQLLKYDTATNTNVAFPYSAFKAGLRQAVDNNEAEGFWTSDSNHVINCEGVEISLSAALNDPSCDVNQLNGAGISTVFNTFGTGIRSWGNRNSTFPVSAGAKSFTTMVRINDIVSETMELGALPYVDKPISQALIDVIKEDGNSFIRTLIQRGALLVGSRIVYNPDDNPPSELAAGHITFERIYMGPTPAERITFKSVLDITLLNNLK